MGAYYKTTDPQDTDFILQSPISLMQQGLQETSDQDDQQIKSLDLFGNAIANVHHLPGQEDQVKAIQQGYQSQIDDATNQILKDPAGYQKHMPLIRNIQRTLSSDLQNGQLAYFNNTADQYNSLIGAAQQGMLGKDGKPGVFTPEQVQAYKSYILNDYNQRVQANNGKAYDPQTGASVPISSEGLYATPNIPSKMKEIEDGIKANSGSYSKDTVTGQWIYTGKQSTEQVEAARVADLTWNSLQSDPEVMGWAKQGQKMGYLNGVAYPKGTTSANGTDLSGQLIAPYTIDKDGNPTFNQSSMFAPIIKSAIDKEAFKKTTQDTSVKDNPYGLETNKSVLDLHREEVMEGIKNQNTQDNEKAKEAQAFENQTKLTYLKAAIAGNTSLKSIMDKVSETGSGGIQSSEGQNGVFNFSPFAGTSSIPGNPNTKLPIDRESVQANMVGSQQRMQDLLNKSQNGNLTQIQRSQAFQDYQKEKDSYETMSSIYDDSHTKAIDDLFSTNGKTKYTKDDLINYYNYQNQKKSFDDQKTNVKKQLLDITRDQTGDKSSMTGIAPVDNLLNKISPVPAHYTNPTKAKELLSHLQNLNNVSNQYDQIGKDLENKENDYIRDGAQKTRIPIEGVGLSIPNKQILYNILSSDSKDIEVRDEDNNNTGIANKINDYLNKLKSEHKDLSNYIDIKTINNPIPGLGVTTTIRLKQPSSGFSKGIFGDAPRNSDAYDKDMIITLPQSSLGTLGSNLKSNGQTETEKTMGDKLLNEGYTRGLAELNNRFVSNDPKGYQGTQSATPVKTSDGTQQFDIVVQPRTVPGDQSKTTYPFSVRYIDPKTNQPVTIPLPDPENPGGEYASLQAGWDAVHKLQSLAPTKR